MARRRRRRKRVWHSLPLASFELSLLAYLSAPFVIEELNEEDQQLKNELEMLVERLHVSYPAALGGLRSGWTLTHLFTGVRYVTVQAGSRSH